MRGPEPGDTRPRFIMLDALEEPLEQDEDGDGDGDGDREDEDDLSVVRR